MAEGRLVGNEVVVGQPDHRAEHLPAWVGGVIVEQRGGATYLISLTRPIVVAGNTEQRLVLSARHLGHPVEGILVGPLGMLLCRCRLPARACAPNGRVVAVPS